jgi:integrase
MAEPELHYGKYRIRWIDENGKRRSKVFESRKVAKAEYKKIVYEVEQIKLGFLKKDNQDVIFDSLAEYWLKNRTAYKRSAKDDQSIINNHFLPHFKGMRIAKIRAVEVDSFKKGLSHLSPKTVSNILTLLISLMKLAVELEWIIKPPVIKKPSTKLFSQDYRFLQSSEEIKKFLDAARSEGEMVFLLYTTAIHTGMRQGELAGLLFSDIDFERNIIVVSRSYTGVTKSDRARYVPLMASLKTLLLAWRQQNLNELVFPNQNGKMHCSAARVFKEIFSRVLARAEFPKVKHNGKLRNHICFHDLRHTFASHWMMNGGELFKLQRILGHQDSKMTQRYAHLSPKAFKDDLSRVAF